MRTSKVDQWQRLIITMHKDRSKHQNTFPHDAHFGQYTSRCVGVLDLHGLYHLQGVSVHCPEATMLQKLPRTITKSCIHNKPTNSHNTHWNYCTTTSTSLATSASLAVLPYLQRIISFATNIIIKDVLNVYFGGKVLNIRSLCFSYLIEALGFSCVLLIVLLINIDDERHLF